MRLNLHSANAIKLVSDEKTADKKMFTLNLISSATIILLLFLFTNIQTTAQSNPNITTINIPTTATDSAVFEHILDSMKVFAKKSSAGKPYAWKMEDGVTIDTTLKLLINLNSSEGTATLKFDVDTPGNLYITLINSQADELLKLHNGTVEIGTFTKTFSLETFPAGVYFITMNYNGKLRFDKIIKE